MTRQAVGSSGEISKLTISTWVYISGDATTANSEVPKEFYDERFTGPGVRQRIPILEFGKSIEPRVGVHIGMSIFWEGYLGWFWCGAGAGVPWFPDYLGDFYIGTQGESKDGWYPFGNGKFYPSVNPDLEWSGGVFFVFFGTSASGAGTDFYYMPVGRDIFPIIPVLRFDDGFTDAGMQRFNVGNDGPLGPNFASYPAGDFYGDYWEKMSWTWKGDIRVLNNFSPGRIAVKEGDIAEPSKLINSEIFFTNFWSSPYNEHMQPTPTRPPYLRVETGGAGKYFGFGDLVIMFPKYPGPTYGEPANPSALYYDGNINFILTAKYGGETTGADQAVVNTLKFSGGGFVLDSWNHIFLTIDLNEMILTGGQDDKELVITIDTLGGPMRARVDLAPPQMEVPPKVTFMVNGKRVQGSITPSLTVYPKKGGHWKSEKTFKMSIDGHIGFPIIPDEKGRWNTTGKNQEIEYAYTHIYLDKYIEPTTKNLNKFFWKSKNPKYNNVIPPPDKKAAVKAFGTPDVWLYRDKNGKVEWINKGTRGSFTNVGTKPEDFRPGPGQPLRKKPKT